MKKQIFISYLLVITAITIYAQDFKTKSITDHVFIVSHPVLGDQAVVKTKKGLVVFDSFWSNKTTDEFKDAITKELNRDDFKYIVNMTDRLDFMGGNNAYTDALKVGHENILSKYRNKEAVNKELKELIELWQGAATMNRNRLDKIEKGSEQEKQTLNWIEQCTKRYSELENYELELPQILYNDRITLNLDDITINLKWFGEVGNYTGLTMAVIPEEKIAILTRTIINPNMHLAPNPTPDFVYLNVPRWISSFEEILESDNAVETIIFGDYDLIISREDLRENLEYIRKLWNRVNALKNEKRSLDEITNQLSFDKEFSFVKEMSLYKRHGERMTKFQHDTHVMLFFLQGKILASKIIEDAGIDSLHSSLQKVRNLRDHGEDIYFHEMYLNRIAYLWMEKGKYSEAIEVLKLAIEALPGSFNLYDSLGEAYLKNGQTELAIKNYKKALELNPENDNARKVLEQLLKK